MQFSWTCLCNGLTLCSPLWPLWWCCGSPLCSRSRWSRRWKRWVCRRIIVPIWGRGGLLVCHHLLFVWGGRSLVNSGHIVQYGSWSVHGSTPLRHSSVLCWTAVCFLSGGSCSSLGIRAFQWTWWTVWWRSWVSLCQIDVWSTWWIIQCLFSACWKWVWLFVFCSWWRRSSCGIWVYTLISKTHWLIINCLWSCYFPYYHCLKQTFLHLDVFVIDSLSVVSLLVSCTRFHYLWKTNRLWSY